MTSKYKWYRFSKYEFPTKSVEGGTTQEGKAMAMRRLVGIVGQGVVDDMIESHTKYEWRWGILK